MTDPTTLSLDDLAAAVVALGAHRKLQCIIDGNHRVVVNSYGADLDLLLTAANRLPAVVARVEELERIVTDISPEHNLLALLDLYSNREREALAGQRRAEAAVRQIIEALRLLGHEQIVEELEADIKEMLP